MYVYACFAEAKRGLQIPWSWTYGQLWATGCGCWEGNVGKQQMFPTAESTPPVVFEIGSGYSPGSPGTHYVEHGLISNSQRPACLWLSSVETKSMCVPNGAHAWTSREGICHNALICFFRLIGWVFWFWDQTRALGKLGWALLSSVSSSILTHCTLRITSNTGSHNVS